MARESIITIFRSLSADTPTGLTFGEFGFAGASRQLFIGGTGGPGASVESIWIGASITGGDIALSDDWAGGTGAYRVSTTEAVKKYIDDTVGTAGIVSSVNGDTGAITITGEGEAAAIFVRRAVAPGGKHFIVARIATDSLTGVASFDSSHFTVTNGKVVASFSGGVTFSGGLSASGLATFSNGLTALGGIHTVGLTATTAVFNGLARFNSGLTTTGLATFSNGLTAPGGIHTVGLTASNGRFTGNLTVDGNTTHTGTVTNTGTQTFNGGIQTTGLTSTGGLSASGLATFSNGLTALGGIHTTGLTATTAVFNGLATFNNGLTTTGLATFSNGLTARGGIFTKGLTANTVFVSTEAVFREGLYLGTQSQNVGIFPDAFVGTVGIIINGDILQSNASLESLNPGTTFAGNVFAPTIKASNIVNQIAVGNATLTGNVSLTSGSNVTMTVVGNQVTIASGGGGATTSALNTWTQTQTFNGGIQTTGLTATNGLSASGLVYFSNGLTAPGGIHTTGLTANTAVFNGLARFNSGLTTTGLATFNTGLTTTGLATFSNGLTAPGGIHTVGLTATTAVFNGLVTFNNGLTTTGLATFNSGLTTTGLATFSNGLTAPGGIHTRGLTASNIVGTNASFSSGVTFTGTPVFSSGLSATGITANTVFANSIIGTNATFTNATFTNDVTVTGNLTVDGTVITANVETIVIEDPLIKLAKNNTDNSVDIGFYGQYQGANTDKRFTGLFRDADADGKYRLFTGLTGGVEPGGTVNIVAQGYTVATLIARLDGGTF